MDLRAPFHQRFDLVHLARHQRDALESLAGDDVIVFDAHAGVLILEDRSAHLRNERAVLRRIGQYVERLRAHVDAWLDRERIADGKLGIGPVFLHRVVHRESDAVRDAVNHPQVRLTTLRRAHGAVHVPRRIEGGLHAFHQPEGG